MKRTKPPSIRRAEAELPARLKKATRLIVYSMRAHGADEAAIREMVSRGFNLFLTRDEPDRMTVDCGGREVPMTSIDGLYAIAVGPERAGRLDLHTQERWAAIIAAALEEALGDQELGKAGLDSL